MKRGLVFVFCLFAFPARASEAGTLQRLRADLLGKESATQVLTHWCADLGLATPPVIKALRSDEAPKPASGEIRRRLGAGAHERIGYRKVRLMCGIHVLSQAENWYRPVKLTAAMNRELDTGDTPFGAVVRALDFHRKTLAVRERPRPGTILEVEALLISAAGTPFSLVVEDYQPDLLRH